MVPGTIITDHHKSIASHLGVHHPEVKHVFDTWHAAKGGTTEIPRKWKWFVSLNRVVL